MEQVAAEQVKVEEKQRVFGVVPNFYVTYEHDAAPLTPKLKFQLAMKALTDPVTISGFGLNAAIYQAADYPSYRQGAAGYGQRLGATFAGGYTKILLGDALLPSLFHQDPRYFYQGTGTARSRFASSPPRWAFPAPTASPTSLAASTLGFEAIPGWPMNSSRSRT